MNKKALNSNIFIRLFILFDLICFGFRFLRGFLDGGSFFAEAHTEEDFGGAVFLMAVGNPARG